MSPRSLPAPADGMLRAGRPTGVVIAFLIFLIVFFAIGIPSMLLSFDGVLAPAGAERWNTVVSLLSFATALGLLWIWVRAKEKRPFASLGFERVPGPSAPRLMLRGAALGLGMVVACMAVPLALGQASLSWASPSGEAFGIVVILLIGFLVQGSTEEILTRGFLTQAVARRFGLVAAVVVQAILFTLLHGINPGIGVLPIINLVLFAVFASCMSLAEGSLWGICVMHGVWNWAQGPLFGVPVSGTRVPDTVFTYEALPGSSDLVTGGAFGLEGSLMTTLVYLVGTGIAVRAYRRRTRTRVAAPAARTTPM